MRNGNDFKRHFAVPRFAAVYANFAGEVPLVDDASSSHKNRFHLTTQTVEDIIDFEFQSFCNYHVALKQRD